MSDGWDDDLPVEFMIQQIRYSLWMLPVDMAPIERIALLATLRGVPTDEQQELLARRQSERQAAWDLLAVKDYDDPRTR